VFDDVLKGLIKLGECPFYDIPHGSEVTVNTPAFPGSHPHSDVKTTEGASYIDVIRVNTAKSLNYSLFLKTFNPFTN